LFSAGLALYASTTRAKDAIGRWALIALAVLLFAFFIFDALDPSAPPSVAVIWISALIATAIILFWAGWIDRHREIVPKINRTP
jgi:protein-S-isoprenylcysteine O-methyltransferase Ste14